MEEIWGVGRRIGQRLNLMGIHNALQLARTHPALIRKKFSTVLERTVRELNDESCIPIEELPPAKQQICCSRSFGERITSKVFMQQAHCQYATRAAEKLRASVSSAGVSVCLFVPPPMQSMRCFMATVLAKS